MERRILRRTPALTLVLAAVLLPSALPLALAVDGSVSATVVNAAPSIVTLALYMSDPAASVDGATCPPGTTTITPRAASTRTVYVCAVVSDSNGWQDVCGASSAAGSRTLGVYDPDGATSLAEALVRPAQHLACGPGSGANITILGSFPMEYWRPAAGTPQDTSAGYLVTLDLEDAAGAAASRATHRFHYSSTKAIGAVAAADQDALTPTSTGLRSVIVANQGNTPLALALTGARETDPAHTPDVGAGGPITNSRPGTTEPIPLPGAAALMLDSGSSSSTTLKLEASRNTNHWLPTENHVVTYVLTAS